MITYFLKCGAISLASLAVIWFIWYILLLMKLRNSTKDWGPRWLAVMASKAFYDFASWQLGYYTDNMDEVIHKGIFGPNKQYVIVWHPHGQYTLAALCFLPYVFLTKVPSKVLTGVADLLLKAPGLAEYLLLLGTRSGSFKTLDKLLAKGYSVAVQPGGLIEQVHTDSRQEKLFFQRGLGFIRLAIKFGIPLIPIYSFGENQLYDTAPWQQRINIWLYKNFRIGNLIVLGRYGPSAPLFPNPGLLPVRGRGLHVRFGNPVEVGPAEAEPSEERVLEVFMKYIDGLRQLFDAYKDECLPPEVAARGLTIIWRGSLEEGKSETVM